MKIFKLLLLKLFVLAYMALMAGIVHAALTLKDVNQWVALGIGIAVAAAIVFMDDREVFSKKIMLFPFSNYSRRKRQQRHLEP
jgi:hypothetical protein